MILCIISHVYIKMLDLRYFHCIIELYLLSLFFICRKNQVMLTVSCASTYFKYTSLNKDHYENNNTMCVLCR